MVRLTLFMVAALLLAFVPMSCQNSSVKVGSKKFTESVILGEMMTLLSRDAGVSAVHYQELGGTQLVFQALVNGDVDVYPEYTGTITTEIFAGKGIKTQRQMAEALQQSGVLMSRPLGFANNYAIGMIRERAEQLGIEKISDLARYPDLHLGFSNEFMDREDGWRNLKKHYSLPHQDANGLDHDLAYRQLRYRTIDAIDVYTTDAKIEIFDLKLLEDDREYFPRYDAVLLYQADLGRRFPSVVASLLRLERSVSQSEMIKANSSTEIDRQTESRVAAEFLEQEFGIRVEIVEQTVAAQIWVRTVEHLDLVRKSLIPAILVAIPLGVFAAMRPRFGQVILGMVGIIQTIPALALLVILLAPVALLGLTGVGVGSVTAIVALFLYSLLPIVRNTYAGLHDIASEYRETASALGLPRWYRLAKIELPLASRSILAGIKTAAVINVGFATLGALIGAGGYGQPIITGLRLVDNGLILQGAIPAAVMAIGVQGLFELAERFFVPRGLRLSPGQ